MNCVRMCRKRFQLTSLINRGRRAFGSIWCGMKCWRAHEIAARKAKILEPRNENENIARVWEIAHMQGHECDCGATFGSPAG